MIVEAATRGYFSVKCAAMLQNLLQPVPQMEFARARAKAHRTNRDFAFAARAARDARSVQALLIVALQKIANREINAFVSRHRQTDR